jgi:hypothetical protein
VKNIEPIEKVLMDNASFAHMKQTIVTFKLLLPYSSVDGDKG